MNLIKFRLRKLIYPITKIITIFSIITTFSLLIIAYTPLSNKLSKYFFIKPNLEKSNAILVLSGGSYPGGILTLFTFERVVQGVSLYKETLGDKIIFIGNTNNHTPADAQAMRELAIKLGVPDEDILVGTTSGDTYLNFQEAAQIMNQNGIKDILLVTSSVHSLRSQLVANKIGVNVHPASLSVDEYREESVDRLILFWYEIRETFALLLYKAKGYI